MSKEFAQVIASRFNTQPALLSPVHTEQLTQALMAMAMINIEDHEKAQKSRGATVLSTYGYAPDAREKPFLFAAGIAFIPVTGLLVNRFNYGFSSITGYNFIRSQMNAALDDEDVKLIVLDCHSGGGEAAGCFELCNEIRASRDRKPSLAVVDSASYSACYAIASSASRVSVIPSGGVGSIGVVSMHIDISELVKNLGVKVTFIHSGDHKVDGNMFEPLPEPVRKSIQSRVDATRQEFVNLVATNRGLDTKVVYDTEAACYSAAEALDLGLIDVIAQPFEAVQAFHNELSRSKPDKETYMSTAQPGAESAASATNKETTATTTAAAVDTPDARKAERERISAITNHAEAKDRAALANHLAFNTELSVEASVAILAASPVEAKGKDGNAFLQAMNNGDHPNVGAGDSTADQDASTDPVARMLKNQSLATGIKHDVKH